MSAAPDDRRDDARRVVLVGAESTGKTTLAMAVVERLRERGHAFAFTQWVPEYGRQYTVEKWAAERAAAARQGLPEPPMDRIVWTTDDFVRIARTQRDMEEAGARAGGPLLICDTDAFATAVWHERYMHHRDPGVEAYSAPADASRRLYLLTHIDDVPFVQDGLRDGFSIRQWMTDTFIARMNERGYQWHWLRGTTVGARADEALRLITGAWPR